MDPNVYCCFNYQNVQRLESIQRKEGKFFYFLTLRGAVAKEYFHLYYNKHLPEEQWGTEVCKFEEKQDDSQNWELNVEMSCLIWCRFLAF